MISVGIFGYPKDQAWQKAIQACRDFMEAYPDYGIENIFVLPDNGILKLSEKTLREWTGYGR